jgi:hypothetical protein
MDSDDYSTDSTGKKRKQIQGEIEIFGSSKKIPRSPTNKRREEKLDMILEIIKDLKSDSTQIKKEQEECREEIKKIREENRKLWEENQELKKENKEIKEKVGEMSNTIEWLEKQKRKNNIVIQGLEINTNDTKILKEGMRNLIGKELGIEVQVKMAYKLGIKTCLIELENEEDKEKIMKNKYKLKNIKNEKIYINDDTTKKEREKDKQMRKFAREEKDKGKEVKIGYNRVTIEGKIWKWNRVLEKLELDHPKN